MSAEKQPRLGVAFLAYNEEELIAKTVEEAVSSLSAVPGLDWRGLVVGDGSRGRARGVVDGEGQHTMADAPRFLEAIDAGADVVFGWKKKRHDPLPRLVLSKGLNTLSRWILGSPLHDINGG